MIKKLLKNNILSNKTVLITGTTSGIGHACLTHLAKLGCNIVACVRNTNLAKEKFEKLKIKYPKICHKIFYLDLQDINSINQLAKDIAESIPEGIDYVICNAGIFARPKKLTDYGYEQHFFTNCVATIYFSKTLLPLLNNNSKLVFVSSLSIKNAKIDFDNIDFKSVNNNIKIYANSKLWLTLYLLEWKTRLKTQNSNYSIEIIHPGICASSLMNSKNGSFSKFTSFIINSGMKILFHSSKKAALCEIAGLIKTTDTDEWIAPCLFGVWSNPAVKKLRPKNANSEIQQKCYETIENILNKV